MFQNTGDTLDASDCGPPLFDAYKIKTRNRTLDQVLCRLQPQQDRQQNGREIAILLEQVVMRDERTRYETASRLIFATLSNCRRNGSMRTRL